MARARTRVVARKVKDRWKSKEWYKVIAPQMFAKTLISETLADDQEKIIGRISEVSMQDLTGDFKQMHIKLRFKVNEVHGSDAHTRFIGHTMTSDYLRRQTRRNRSKIDGVFDVKTKDGSKIRVKPSAMTDRRIQSSQKSAVKKIMAEQISTLAADSSMSAFIKAMLDGTLATRIYKKSKDIYPLRRVEIAKSEVMATPKIELEDDEQAYIIQPEAPEVPEVEETAETEEAVGEFEPSEEEETEEAGEESVEEAADETAEMEEAVAEAIDN